MLMFCSAPIHTFSHLPTPSHTRDAEFTEVEAVETPEDAAAYDAAVTFWRRLRNCLEAAETLLPLPAPALPGGRKRGREGEGGWGEGEFGDGGGRWGGGRGGGGAGGGAGGGGEGAGEGGKKGRNRGDLWKAFWATQQRFFKLLCVSMKVRT